MVRNLAGVLLEVGKGNLERDDLLKMLDPGAALRAGPTAPACGLYLVEVDYTRP
jgi:tRNA pseudouridine38-40 synthase